MQYSSVAQGVYKPSHCFGRLISTFRCYCPRAPQSKCHLFYMAPLAIDKACPSIRGLDHSGEFETQTLQEQRLSRSWALPPAVKLGHRKGRSRWKVSGVPAVGGTAAPKFRVGLHWRVLRDPQDPSGARGPGGAGVYRSESQGSELWQGRVLREEAPCERAALSRSPSSTSTGLV